VDDREAAVFNRVFSPKEVDRAVSTPVAVPPTQPLSQVAYKYLADRGISTFTYGLLEGTGYLAGRIVIPYPGSDFWKARAYLPDILPKYLSPKITQRPYYYLKGRIAPTHLWLVEGEFDAMSLHSIGLTAAAIGGSHASPQSLVNLLADNRIERVTVALDGDAPGKAFKAFRCLFGMVPVDLFFIGNYSGYKDFNAWLVGDGEGLAGTLRGYIQPRLPRM
jgi:hypothetical protein